MQPCEPLLTGFGQSFLQNFAGNEFQGQTLTYCSNFVWPAPPPSANLLEAGKIAIPILRLAQASLEEGYDSRNNLLEGGGIEFAQFGGHEGRVCGEQFAGPDVTGSL